MAGLSNLFLFVTAISFVACQKALLLTSSVGYYNYRQQANVLELYRLLKHYGFEDQHLLLSFPENIGCCEKNPLQGSISFRDNEYTNINRQIEVDYKYYSISAESVANFMAFKYNPAIINRKRLELDDQPYLVYFTGHGGDFYFKIRERQALVSQNFEHALKDLSMRRPRMPIFIVVDSCSAITPYEGLQQENVIALGSSSFGEKSLSKGYDKLVNSPKSDEFTFYLSDFIQNNNLLKTNVTIRNLYEYMDFTKLKVHSKLVSKSRKNQRKYLRQFMTRSPSAQEKMLQLTMPQSFVEVVGQQTNDF